MTAEELLVDVRLPLGRFELSVRFRTEARVLGLWGPSGCGKTTLLEIVAGLRKRAKGRVALGSRVWLDSSTGRFVQPEHRTLGYVPQESLLFPNLTVHGNLAAAARRARRLGWDASHAMQRAASTLRIEALLHRDVATLSGGERQRVALARALCSAPTMLLLDEPFASLDWSLRRSLLSVLARIRDDFCVPMLVVSHDPTEMQVLCDEVVSLRDGTAVTQGRPKDVLPWVAPQDGAPISHARSVSVVAGQEFDR